MRKTSTRIEEGVILKLLRLFDDLDEVPKMENYKRGNHGVKLLRQTQSRVVRQTQSRVVQNPVDVIEEPNRLKSNESMFKKAPKSFKRIFTEPFVQSYSSRSSIIHTNRHVIQPADQLLRQLQITFGQMRLYSLHSKACN